MGSKNRSSFVNTRARLQRLSDAKFFSGWVHVLTHNEVVLELTCNDTCSIGDVFGVQAHGRDRTASMTARVVSIDGNEITMTLLDRIRMLAQSENARFYVADLTGVVRGPELEEEVTLIDVSTGGAAFTSPKAIERGKTVELELAVASWLVKLPAEIRYCRPEKDGSSYFRVGVTLLSLDRLDRARWISLVDDTMCA